MRTVGMSSGTLGLGWRRRLGLFTALALLSSLVAVTPAAASVSPSSATITITAGGSATETKTVGVPAVPAKADIEIAIDTTGSMQASITQAQTDALNIVSGVQGVVPDTQFAVVAFKDFCTATQPVSGPGCSTPPTLYPGDYPEYQVVQSMTPTGSDVQTALNSLTADGGGDNAEAYNTVFHNSYNPGTGGSIGWRAGTRKFVVVIGDAEPHDAGTDGVAGCADSTPDPHGLSAPTELAGMNAAERTLLMIRQVSSQTTTSLACYQGLAALGFTGGDAIDGGGSLATQIVNLINAAFANVNAVHLEVASASPAPASASWISFTPASVGPVPAPSTQTFTLTATVPSATPSGTYTFDIVALADGIDIGHQALTIVVNRPTTLVYNGDTTQDYHDSATLSAVLSDGISGTPIAGETVDFTLGAQSCSGTTDVSGTASCALILNQVPGPYVVTADFAGTTALTPSSTSSPFTITREETTTTYTGPTVIANGQPTSLSAVLKEDGTTPIAGRTLTLTLGTGGTAQSCTGITNVSGSASCTITPAQPLGAGTVKADFAGDSFYLPSSDAASTVVFAFLAHGSFVIGDGNQAAGTHVTFWGAQWAKLNTLSGGAAPNAFKGFAGSTSTPPQCGSGWTTDPGNSTPPPAGPLPAYMGVIVSSAIGQSGSTISGNTVHIVVVKTDPGYAGNPGHAGTGTVIATFC